MAIWVVNLVFLEKLLINLLIYNVLQKKQVFVDKRSSLSVLFTILKVALIENMSASEVDETSFFQTNRFVLLSAMCGGHNKITMMEFDDVSPHLVYTSLVKWRRNDGIP